MGSSPILEISDAKNFLLPTSEQEKNIVCSGVVCVPKFTLPNGGRLCLPEKGSWRTKMYVCLYEKCDKKFITLHDLNQHIKYNLGIKSYKCQYNNCNYKCVM